jgi:hypothetical protein
MITTPVRSKPKVTHPRRILEKEYNAIQSSLWGMIHIWGPT